MRALLCHCHHHLEAEDDDALCAVVREHLLWRHPAMEPSEEQASRSSGAAPTTLSTPM